MIRIAKLTTDDIGVVNIKSIVTDGAPSIVVAKFNTSFISNRTSNQSDVPRWTNCGVLIIIKNPYR